MKVPLLFSLLSLFVGMTAVASTQEAESPRVRAEIERWIVFAKKLAAEPSLVEAVVAQNQRIAPEYADMEQIKWAALAELDPLVTALAKGPAGQVLKAGKIQSVSEIFVSDGMGRKVALLAKTTNWSHAGKAKHEDPMKGKNWVGRVEHDESTGRMQIQVAVPVLREGQPVGSLVLGVEIAAVVWR